MDIGYAPSIICTWTCTFIDVSEHTWMNWVWILRAFPFDQARCDEDQMMQLQQMESHNFCLVVQIVRMFDLAWDIESGKRRIIEPMNWV